MAGFSDHRVVAVNVAARMLGTTTGSASRSVSRAAEPRMLEATSSAEMESVKQTNAVAVSLTRGGFVIRKVSSLRDKDGNRKPLSGATFTLTGNDQSNKSVNVSAETDDNGEMTFLGLPDGTYTLTESAAPAGYDASKPVRIEVRHNAKPQQDVEKMTLESIAVLATSASGALEGKGTAANPYIIEDSPLVASLPRTGGTGMATVIVAVIAAAVLGLLMALLASRIAPRGRHVR